MRHATTAAIALATTLVLPGCSGSADSGSPDPSPSPRTSTPAPTPPASPTPTAPVMPEAAKAHTKAGARAFVEYFWEVVDYASSNLDPEAIDPLVTPGCRPCDGGIASIKDVKARGGSIRGGESEVRNSRVQLLSAGGNLVGQVDFVATNAPQTIDYPGTAEDTTRPADAVRMTMFLRTAANSWQVDSWEIHE